MDNTMDNTKEEKSQPAKTATQFDWDKFLEMPEVKQAIPQLVDLWKKNLDIKERTANKARNRFLIMTIILFLATVVSVTWLTLANRISSEATAFLLGVIITGAISIIRDFTGGR